MPSLAEALAQGEVSDAAVGLLVAAREACPEAFAEAERTLVDAGHPVLVRS